MALALLVSGVFILALSLSHHRCLLTGTWSSGRLFLLWSASDSLVSVDELPADSSVLNRDSKFPKFWEKVICFSIFLGLWLKPMG